MGGIDRAICPYRLGAAVTMAFVMNKRIDPDTGFGYDRVAHDYDVSRALPRRVAEQLWQVVRNTAQLADDSVVLDAAAGTGRFTLAAAAAGLRAVAVDRSSGMLDVMRRKNVSAGNAIQCALGDITSLPLRGGTIDAVLMVHILHLLPNVGQALAEARRVLVSGGALFAAREEREEISLRARYVSLAAGMGAATGPGAGLDAILAELRESGAQVDRVDDDALCWQRRLTWAEALEQLKRRSWHHQWSISSAAHDAVMAQLEAWMLAERISPEREWTGAAAIHLWRVRWPL